MALNVGSRLGHYQVTAKLGEGGMGEVWEATDTKLNRKVALKILPEAFATDPDRLARFQREAQVLASLNHPGIAAIYGIEEADDTRALVLELVEGPTVADRIAQGPVPVDEALPIAKQIAEALAAAHEAGVVHRDLKPANIKVREDGTVKVLDFGLAKALQGEAGGDPSESPTLTAAATATGVLMGTAAYMSPEQAKGKVVDKRTDVWAFGCVVFEMLTGRRAFGGDTVSETLVSVLSKDAPLDDLPPRWPPAGRRLLRRCFEREPHSRLRDVTDGLLQTAEEFEGRSGDRPSGVSPATVVPGRRVLPWVAAFGLAVVTGLGMWLVTRPDALGTVRFALSGDGANPFVLLRQSDVAVSPDGRYVAYLDGADETGTGAQRIRLRRVDQLASETLVEGGGLRSPFFSADGGSVGFFTARTGEVDLLQRVSIQGGPTSIICELPSSFRGASWGADDTIVFAMRERLWNVPADGGEPAQLSTPNQAFGEVTHRWPEVLPGSEAVLFTINGDSRDEAQIAVLSLDTGEHEVVFTGGSYPRYSLTEHVVYSAHDSLWAVGFDPGRVEVVGEPVLVQEAVSTKANGASSFDISEKGSLVYIPAEGAEALRTMVWVSPEGQEEPLNAPPALYESPRLSPDGRYVAVEIRNPGNRDVVIYDLERGTTSPLTGADAGSAYPSWTPDGRRVVFQPLRDGSEELYSKAADGTGEAEKLTTNTNTIWPETWSRDGQILIVGAFSGRQIDVHTLAFGTATETEPLLDDPTANELSPQVSPNNRWIAYSTDETGRQEIYVRPFPDVDSGRRVQISQGGGAAALWSHDGTKLYFRPFDSRLMVVTVDTASPEFSAGIPEFLLDTTPYLPGSAADGRIRTHDMGPDGRFLMVKEGGSQGIVVVLNWLQELTERVRMP